MVSSQVRCGIKAARNVRFILSKWCRDVRETKGNVARWQADCESIHLHAVALSDRNGMISIGFSPDFIGNSGVAYATHGQVHEGIESRKFSA